jgi:hypothetical protein
MLMFSESTAFCKLDVCIEFSLDYSENMNAVAWRMH